LCKQNLEHLIASESVNTNIHKRHTKLSKNGITLYIIKSISPMKKRKTRRTFIQMKICKGNEERTGLPKKNW